MDCPPQSSQLQTFTTPVATKKKVIRRTNAQIQADSTLKKAAAAKKSELNAAIESAKKKVEPQQESFIELKGKRYEVQPSRTNWTVEEQVSLIRCYKKWEAACEKSQDKKLVQVSKMWLVEIPALMGKDYGKVRLTPSNNMGSSPYKSKWQDIRKKVSDYKAAQPDGREEELPDSEGPTGGGDDEYGVESERSEKANEVELARNTKRNERYVANAIDKESMTVITYFLKSYPQSITGVGVMSENDLVSGAGRKRESCEMTGLAQSATEGDFEEAPPAKKLNKASLILDLTRSATAHHVENMEFQRNHFEYQKEARKEDVARLNARDVREVDYRERLDNRDQERYDTEQIRLAKEQIRLISAQNDARNMNEVLGAFLTSIAAKL